MVIRALRGERGLTRHARPRVLLRGCLPEPSRQSHQRAHALRAPRAHTRVPFVRVEGNRRVADRYFAEKKASGMRGIFVDATRCTSLDTRATSERTRSRNHDGR